ncbi:hypothetical protein ONZ45_g18834 [Pleurotus djamor]|nr:hypothetical protein ONZ45_g18834 [Pleurotus djamor]
MSDDTARIPRLNDSNYAEWSIYMEAYLTKKGLFSLVHYEPEATKKEEIAAEMKKWRTERKAKSEKFPEARAEMILRAEGGQLVHMQSRDPAEIWSTLKRVHQAVGFATSLALRRQFLTAKKRPEQPMQAWISQIQGLALRMEAAGINVDEQDKILAVTMGLPETYGPVIINFDATSPDLLTFNHVITRLLNEETRQAATEVIVKKEEDEENENVVMSVVASHGRTGRGQPNPAEVNCFFCQERGHYRSECPDRLAWERMKERSRESKGKKVKELVAALVEPGLDSDSEDQGFF